MQINPSEFAVFVCGLARAKAKPFGWCVDDWHGLQNIRSVHVIQDNAGFAITFDNELVHVWSDGGGYIRDIVNMARQHGATWLSCFDGKLVELYSSAGCMERSRAPFDERYAPKDWSGKEIPDYVTMDI